MRVSLLFTYSGMTDPRVEPVAKSKITLTSLATACRAASRTKVVPYSRPIVPGWNGGAHAWVGALHAISGLLILGLTATLARDALANRAVTYHAPGGRAGVR